MTSLLGFILGSKQMDWGHQVYPAPYNAYLRQ